MKQNNSSDEAIRTAHAYIYVAAAFALLAMIAACITASLFFGAAWGMATFTLFCVVTAIHNVIQARAKVREAKEAATDE